MNLSTGKMIYAVKTLNKQIFGGFAFVVVIYLPQIFNNSAFLLQPRYVTQRISSAGPKEPFDDRK